MKKEEILGISMRQIEDSLDATFGTDASERKEEARLEKHEERTQAINSLSATIVSLGFYRAAFVPVR